MSVIGGDFVLESVVQCAAFVRYSGAENVLRLREERLVHPRWSVIRRRSAIGRVRYRSSTVYKNEKINYAERKVLRSLLQLSPVAVSEESKKKYHRFFRRSSASFFAYNNTHSVTYHSTQEEQRIIYLQFLLQVGFI